MGETRRNFLRVMAALGGTALVGCDSPAIAGPHDNNGHHRHPPPPPIDPPPPVVGDIITVDPSATFQTIDGFGSSQRMFDDPHLNGGQPTASTGGLVISEADRNVIINLLWSYSGGIGLNRMRTSPANISGGWQSHEGAPIVPDAPYPGPNATKVKELLASILAINPEFKIGVEPGFDSWVLTAPDDKAAAYIKTQIDYLKAGGFEADWIGVTNEPSLQYGFQQPERVKNVALSLKVLFDADAQYGDRVGVVAADDVGDSQNAIFASVMLGDATLKPWIKAVATHPYYGESLAQSSAIATANGLPLWMTEYNAENHQTGVSFASDMIHPMLTTFNLAAWDNLFGFGASNITAKPYCYVWLKTSDGINYSGYELQPWYYQIGHWSKYVKRGAVRIAASSSQPDIKTTAFLQATKKIIVLINTSSSSTYTVTIPSGSYRCIQTVFAGADRLADKGLVSGSTALPVTSMTTLVEQ